MTIYLLRSIAIIAAIVVVAWVVARLIVRG